VETNITCRVSTPHNKRRAKSAAIASSRVMRKDGIVVAKYKEMPDGTKRKNTVDGSSSINSRPITSRGGKNVMTLKSFHSAF
jgi:hypothetical protein